MFNDSKMIKESKLGFAFYFLIVMFLVREECYEMSIVNLWNLLEEIFWFAWAAKQGES